MPKYTLEMRREVITIDRYTVEVEAENEDDAEAKGVEMAYDMNEDCPDGVEQTGDFECRSWGLKSVKSIDA